MGKRLRRARSICCCTSPRLSVRVSRQSNVNWYYVDIWTEIAKFMDGRSLVMLAVTCKWFNRTMMEDSIWKFACLRDLQVPDPGNVNFKWIKLYTTAFGKFQPALFHKNLHVVREFMSNFCRRKPLVHVLENSSSAWA